MLNQMTSNDIELQMINHVSSSDARWIRWSLIRTLCVLKSLKFDFHLSSFWNSGLEYFRWFKMNHKYKIK